jgi:hypothetical protein
MKQINYPKIAEIAEIEKGNCENCTSTSTSIRKTGGN